MGVSCVVHATKPVSGDKPVAITDSKKSKKKSQKAMVQVKMVRGSTDRDVEASKSEMPEKKRARVTKKQSKARQDDDKVVGEQSSRQLRDGQTSNKAEMSFDEGQHSDVGHKCTRAGRAKHCGKVTQSAIEETLVHERMVPVSAESLYDQGKRYFNGIGLAVDRSKAKACFEQSAERGNKKAVFYLGLCYYFGLS